MKNAYIYGAGDYGTRLLSFIQDSNSFNILGFIQSVEKNEEVAGLRVYWIENVKINPEDFVLIAISDETTIHTIYVKLLSKGVRRNRIVNCADLVRNNLPLGQYYCIICGHPVEHFLPGQVANSKLFKTHTVIGAGYRENMLCPYCHCMDRERWLYFVLTMNTDIFTSSCHVLHFAPESHIKERMKSNKIISYIAADLLPKDDEIQVDITDIPFQNNTFDYVIANHVLEHIGDEKKAIMELKRVLKQTGKLIISFPICTDMRTIEKEGVESEEEREELYGQKDHVRLYGFDFKERLLKYGIEVSTLSPKDYFDDDTIKKLGFIENDVIIICKNEK